MKKFVFKAFCIVILPVIILSTILIVWDPFKVFFQYDEYYKNNHIVCNREDIGLQFLKRNLKKKVQYNSFIIGSSRSQAFKTPDWQSHLHQANFQGFHFDGSVCGLFRIYNKVKYLDEHVDSIKNVLLVIDHSTFYELTNPPGYLFAQNPELSHESAFLYYFKFVRASAAPWFLIANIDYALSKKYKKYMDLLINTSKYDFVSDNVTADLYYPYDRELKEDSAAYYSRRIKAGVFVREKDPNAGNDIPGISVQRLKEIHNIFVKHKTNYKIIISPLYDQIKLRKKDLTLLKDIFGEKNIYDFSGDNVVTRHYYNYYENSHYRPFIARRILDSIYNQRNFSEPRDNEADQ